MNFSDPHWISPTLPPPARGRLWGVNVAVWAPHQVRGIEIGAGLAPPTRGRDCRGKRGNDGVRGRGNRGNTEGRW